MGIFPEHLLYHFEKPVANSFNDVESEEATDENFSLVAPLINVPESNENFPIGTKITLVNEIESIEDICKLRFNEVNSETTLENRKLALKNFKEDLLEFVDKIKWMPEEDKTEFVEALNSLNDEKHANPI